MLSSYAKAVEVPVVDDEVDEFTTLVETKIPAFFITLASWLDKTGVNANGCFYRAITAAELNLDFSW